MINRHIYLVLILLLIPLFTYSQDSGEFTVTFKPLIMKGIDEKYLHLKNSLPMSLFSELQNADLHHYSESEIVSIRKKNFKNLKNNYLESLSQLIEQHDKFLFSNDFNEPEYLTLGEKIVAQKKILADLDIRDVEIPESSVPIRFNIEAINTTDKGITNSNLSSTSNLTIEGKIEKVDDWVSIQFWVENAILDTDRQIYESVSSLDNLSKLIPEISSKLKSVLLGRPWAAIEFNVKPEGSNILIKDEKNTPVNLDLGILYPGIYTVNISEPGYKAVKNNVDLAESETRVISVTLEEGKKSTVSLQTFPAGADLYLGSTWLGKTPLLIPNPIVPALLTFKLEGYNDSQYVYKTKKEKDIKIFMHSDIIDREKTIRNKRNVFYKSFSFFLLSIPVTLVSYGLSSDYGYTYNREVINSYNSSKASELMQLSTTWYNVYLSSIFINITLFVNTVIDLVDYIKSNNYL